MSAAQPAFHVGRRPLTTPIQPGQHLYNAEMSHADEVFSDPNLVVDPSLAPMDPIIRAPMDWQVYPTGWRQYSKNPMPSYPMLEQGQYYHNPYAQWQTRMEQAPLVSFGRHESPISQHPSFSSGESLSPPTESDAYPRTPPDTSASSPFQPSHGLSDVWDTCNSQHLFMGMGHAHESLSVNPNDINPSQAAAEGSVALSRSSSFGAESSRMKFRGPPSFESFGHDQDSDIQTMPEIRVHTPAESEYPDPDNEVDGELEASQDDKKDGDWSPKRTRRRSSDKKMAAASRHGGRGTRKRIKREDGSSPAPGSNSRVPPKATSKGSAAAYLCGACDESFHDEADLQKHRKSKHLRPFTCIFHFAGCTSRFPSKNEWKRHVMTQHLALHYWLCTQGGCLKSSDAAPGQSQRSVRTSAPALGALSLPAHLPDGAIFNRKDLYTQHVRRMHVPQEYIKNTRNKKPEAEWEERLRELQGEAEQTRCQLPIYMVCPAAACSQEFHGATAWDDRMEHVAKHLDKASEGAEPPLAFGGVADQTLTAWAESPEVGVVHKVGEGRWELVNMLRGSIGPSRGNGKSKGGRKAAAAAAAAAVVPRKRQAEEEPEEEDAEGDED